MNRAQTSLHFACGLALIFSLSDCKKKTTDSPTPKPIDSIPVTPVDTTPAAASDVSIWVTNPEASGARLTKSNVTIKFKERATSSNPLITVNPAQTYQTFDGVGAAVTGSSAYLLMRRQTATQREALIRELFGTDGTNLGLNSSRMTIGASDFSLDHYSYDDMPNGQTDVDMVHFNLGRDSTDLVPALQQILAVNPNLQLMGSPWSPPGWMKTTGSMLRGTLKPEYEAAYAKYFVRYVQAFQAKGIPIHSITTQNEPLHDAIGYPSMVMDAGQQSRFIRTNLGPAFQAAGLQTKIYAYDHNWDRPDYPMSVLGNSETAQYLAGTAFHGYGGSPDAMSTVHNAFPNKDIVFSEQSAGGWAGPFANILRDMTRTYIIGNFRNWSRSILFWNLALDQTNGPRSGGCADCTGLVTINTSTGAITRNAEYYILGHVSRFVKPGAVRIESNTSNELPNVVFRNPDGSQVMLVVNTTDTFKSFDVKTGSKYYAYNLAAGSVATLVWRQP